MYNASVVVGYIELLLMEKKIFLFSKRTRLLVALQPAIVGLAPGNCQSTPERKIVVDVFLGDGNLIFFRRFQTKFLKGGKNF
jgi:hypothetical protein